MCYSSYASLWALSIGILGSALLAPIDVSLSVIFAFVTIMQLYDALFWTFPEHTPINAIVTKLAMMSNHLQPLVIAASIYFLKGLPLQSTSFSLLAAYFGAVLVYTVIHYGDVKYTTVTPDSDPSLDWEWNYKKGNSVVYSLFLATITALFLQHYEAPIGLILAAISVLTVCVAIWKRSKHTTGRFWCHYAAYIPASLFVFLSTM